MSENVTLDRSLVAIQLAAALFLHDRSGDHDAVASIVADPETSLPDLVVGLVCVGNAMHTWADPQERLLSMALRSAAEADRLAG